MRDLTHYFQTSANLAKKSPLQSENSAKVLTEYKETIEDIHEPNNSSQKRNTLSLKHKSENYIKIEEKKNNSAKDGVTNSFTNNSQNPHKKIRGRPKKVALTSTSPDVIGETQHTASNKIACNVDLAVDNPEVKNKPLVTETFETLIEKENKGIPTTDNLSKITEQQSEPSQPAIALDHEELVKPLDEGLNSTQPETSDASSKTAEDDTKICTKREEQNTEVRKKRKYTKQVKSSEKEIRRETSQESSKVSREPGDAMNVVSGAKTLKDSKNVQVLDETDDIAYIGSECKEQESKKLKSDKGEIAKISTEFENTPQSKIKVSNVFQVMMSGGNKKTIKQDSDEESELIASNSGSKRKNKLSLKHSNMEDAQDEKKKFKKTQHQQSKKKKSSQEESVVNASTNKEMSLNVEHATLKQLKSKEDEIATANLQPQKDSNEVDKKYKKSKLDIEEKNVTITKSIKSEKSPDAFKLLMSTKNQQKSQSKVEEETEEPKKVVRSKGKRKRIVTSDDESEISEVEVEELEHTTPIPSKPSGLYGYFTPVSREEAIKKNSNEPVIKTVAAEVHQAPSTSSPEEAKRHSLGPQRRPQRLSSKKEEEITVISLEETSEKGKPKKPFKFKTPDKKKKKKSCPWQLKIKLLSPAKPLEESSDNSSCSDSDSDYMDLSDSPKRTQQSDLKVLWASKRKDLPLAPIFKTKAKNSAAQSNPSVSKVSRKIIPTVAMPLMRPAPTEHIIGFADVDPNTPLSVLFSSLQHVTQAESSDCNDHASIDLPPVLLPPVQAPACPPVAVGDLITPSDEPPCVTRPTLVLVGSEDNKSSESWCDKYRPCCAAEVAGNARSVQRLRGWLEGWMQRSGAQEERNLNSSDSESSDYSSGDDFICSDDDDSTKGRTNKKKKRHCNTALLVGPCGSGKTAAVYAAAEELGFKVLEMNASSRRSGKRILSELQEATQSHQVRNTDQETLNAFFSGPNKGKDKSKEEAMESQQVGGNAGLSLILVEDVDVVFEEQDEGFLAALNVLAASSKRPLILVSNEPQCPLLLARQHRLHLEFTRVPTVISGPVIQRMCQAEGETVSEARLNELLILCGGDLRRAVLLAQTWTCSGGFPQHTKNQMLAMRFPLDLSAMWLGLSHTSLPFIITDTDQEGEEIVEAEKLDNSDNIFSLPKAKKKSQKRRLTSENLDSWEFLQQQAIPCPDLNKTLLLADMMATLDVLQGAGAKEWCSSPRPGLSDQPCKDGAPDRLASRLQHWLASRAVKASGCSLTLRSTEEIDRWRGAHCRVDATLLEQLPLTNQLERRAVATDLLPALRGLGCSEQVFTRSSRRSKINALHTLGFTPDALTLETLPFVLPQAT